MRCAAWDRLLRLGRLYWAGIPSRPSITSWKSGTISVSRILSLKKTNFKYSKEEKSSLEPFQILYFIYGNETFLFSFVNVIQILLSPHSNSPKKINDSYYTEKYDSNLEKMH